ncbi:GNAT family protein [Paracoccus sp. MBLB3053]|uniref:GNAT family protein n=1 Tax=Paracoccus aurantius TaxID=3073814 RepID=A0ABU2HVZ0_9RHOB|nr:GNAT family protein [Paracoccus sp. MBLB3053]MDS9468454.1 GNAT family protein [Paracoccus sp. MBLB3053]
MIALEPLGRHEFDRVAHIEVTPEQQPFCGTVPGHFEMDEPGCDFHVVIRDGHAVGFFKIDREFATRFDFALSHEIGLRGMMIDRNEQGQGTGKAAILALRPYLQRLYPDASNCVLTVNIINLAARSVYLSGGFQDEGGLFHGGRIGPQHILRMNLSKTAVA